MNNLFHIRNYIMFTIKGAFLKMNMYFTHALMEILVQQYIQGNKLRKLDWEQKS